MMKGFLNYCKAVGDFDAFECTLGINEIANNCGNWQEETNFYVYYYHDIFQLNDPVVYVGIGKNDRYLNHWNAKSHNALLNEWIEFWKSSSASIDDVATVAIKNLTQRQAAAIECFLIKQLWKLGEAEANVVSYWTPEGTEKNEKARFNTSLKLHGREPTTEQNIRRIVARTNKLKIKLLLHDEPIKLFHDTSQTQIAEWIRHNYNLRLNPGSLWKTLQTSKTTVQGFSLQSANYRPKVEPLQQLRIQISSNPIVGIDVAGNVKAFVSTTAAEFKLKISKEDINGVLKEKKRSSHGWYFRFITEQEIERNIHRWPLFYEVTKNNLTYRFLNKAKFCRQHDINASTLSQFFKQNDEYFISRGVKYSGQEVVNYMDNEIYHFEIIHDLTQPEVRPVAPKTSTVSGVTFNRKEEVWVIHWRKKKMQVNIGKSPNKVIAEEVGRFVLKKHHMKNVISDARDLLWSLNQKAGFKVPTKKPSQR